MEQKNHIAISVSGIENPETLGGGVILNPPPVPASPDVKTKKEEKHKTQKNIRCRKWVFTLNNYTNEEVEELIEKLESKNRIYIMGKETAPTTGTPHIQGYIESKNPMTFDQIKGLNNRMNIQKARGTLEQNWAYCTKDGDYLTNIDPPTEKKKNIKEEDFKDKLKKLVLDKEYKNIKWKDWQQEIIDILEEEPDKRIIHWYYEETGNTGKSYLAKYLAITKNVIICSGKKGDIFNQVLTAINNEMIPEIILLDIPRTNNEYVNYATIEELKRGFIYSGKYEGGQCIFPIPHIIAFSNERPDESKLSMDRWHIVNIKE